MFIVVFSVVCVVLCCLLVFVLFLLLMCLFFVWSCIKPLLFVDLCVFDSFLFCVINVCVLLPPWFCSLCVLC